MFKLTGLLTRCACACLVTATALLAEPDFQPGGVTFPMEQISSKRFSPTGDPKVNLIDNRQLNKQPQDPQDKARPWTNNIWIFHKENRDRFNGPSAKVTSAKFIDDGPAKAMELNRPIALEQLMGDKVQHFTIGFRQVIKLPDLNGGTYRFTMETKSQLVGNSPHRHMALFWFKDASNPRPGHGKETRSYLFSGVQDAPQWHLHAVDFQVPPNTRDLELVIRADGCGKLTVRNPALVKLAASKTPITVEMAPVKLLDNTFALAPGAPGIMNFKFRSNLPNGKLKAEGYVLNLELPADITVRGTNRLLGKTFTKSPCTINGTPANRWQIPCDAIIPYIRTFSGFNGWSTPTVLITTDAQPGQTWPNCRYYVTLKDQKASNLELFTMATIAPIPKVTIPKQFLTGFSSVGGDITMHQPEAKKLLADFFAHVGSNLIAHAGDAEQRKLLRQNGVTHLTSEAYCIANGFRIGIADKTKKDKDSFYLDKDGKPVRNGSIFSTCPTSVYTRSNYYRTIVLPQLKQELEGKDGLQPNWEPYSFMAKGCFCDNCREEFARFAKLSPEKVREIWPQQLLPGFSYRDQAIRFRAYQHGRLIKTLHEDTLKLGATAIGFCPEVGTDQIIKYPNHFYEQWEYTPYEYAGDLKWLNVWGPYVWFIATEPYNYRKGAHLETWEMSKRVIRDYRNHFTDPNHRAKLMAMPHGNQCNITALGQPEGLAMDQLSSFLAGYDASELYFFPRGYDHRFWTAAAYANQRIAEHEDMVMNGRREQTDSVTPTTPFPAPLENVQPRYLPDVRLSDLLQVQSFNRDGTRLVAIGNFWEKGDVVAKLTAQGLAPTQTYQVTEREFNRAYVSAEGKNFTGRQLAEGILVHVGALRWAFLEITPAPQPGATAIQATPRHLAALQLRLRKANAPAAIEEAKRDQALHAENDIGDLKTLSHGKLAAKPVLKNSRQMLQVTDGKNTVILDPKGMTVHSWLLNGQEQVEPGWAKSAFWSPGKNGMVADGNFRFGDQVLAADGFRASATCMTTPRNYPQLHGLKLVKDIRIAPDFRHITVTVRLHNTQAESMNAVGYRWFFQPAPWQNKFGGTIRAGSQSFQRPRDFVLWNRSADPQTEKTIRRLFQVKQKTLSVPEHTFRFLVPKRQNMTVAFLPAESLSGVAIWDTPGMAGATFEPFYKDTLIPPGGNTSYSVTFSVEQP